MTLWYAVRVLWLCGFATFVLAAAAFLFIGNDQGADFLRILAEPLNVRSGWAERVAFVVSVIAWSLGTWYSCRLLLIRKLPGFPLPPTPTAGLREWTPRVLGALAPIVIGTGFGVVALSDTEGLRDAMAWWAAGYIGLAVVLFLFYWARRTLFTAWTAGIAADAYLSSLPTGSQWVITTAIVASFVLLLIFVAAPVGAARFLGTPAVFVAAGTAILLFGSIVLSFVPLSNGYPGLLLPVLLWAALVSLWNDNHGFRTTQAVAYHRDPPVEHLQGWLAQALKGTAPTTSDRSYPIFIVAAAGGGIRAAYWPGVLLGTIADQVGADPWRRHLYAVSGVSGGSLGAAVHLIELAAPVAGKGYAEQARDTLKQDFLSPLAAYMLYPDLLQRFLPIPIPIFDRARALEWSWEDAGRSVLRSDAFSESFLALWTNHASDLPLPALLVNSTRVQTGQRAILSNLDLTDSDFFLDTVDLLGQQLPDALHPREYSLKGFDALPLSTAIHLSARFTYVSPAATVRDGEGRLWGRLVDGGYFENSGAATARELIEQLCQRSGTRQEWHCGKEIPGVRVFPVVLLIKNDPQAPSVCSEYAVAKNAPTRFLAEVRSPIDALLATRDARGRLAENELAQLLHSGDAEYARSCGDGCLLEFALAHDDETQKTDQGTASRRVRARYADPPLGWSLSEESRSAMDARLGDPAIVDRMKCVGQLIDQGRCEQAPQCGVLGASSTETAIQDRR
jgi:hypothetical protein